MIGLPYHYHSKIVKKIPSWGASKKKRRQTFFKFKALLKFNVDFYGLKKNRCKSYDKYRFQQGKFFIDYFMSYDWNTVYPRFYRTSCLRYVGGWEINDKFGGRHMEDLRMMWKLNEERLTKKKMCINTTN